MNNLTTFGKVLFASVILIILVFVIASSLWAETIINSEGYWLDMAIDNDGKQHLSYAEGSSVYYRFKPKNGNWSNAFIVPGSSNTYNTRFSPHIAADKQGSAHIVWCNYDQTRIYYNSWKKGQGWTGLQIAIQDFIHHPQWPKQDTVRPGIACTGNNEILVVAQNDNKITCNWIHPGSQFNHSNYITLDEDPSEPKSPSIAGNLKSNKGFCFWTRSAKIKGSIFHGINDDGFGSMFYISGGGSCCPNNSDTFIDEFENIYIAYWETATHTTDIASLNYVSRINNNWSPIKSLTDGQINIVCEETECPFPRVAVVDNGTIIVMYSTSTNIYYFVKKAGSGWSNKKFYSKGNYPSLTVDGNIAHIAYAHNKKIIYDTMNLGSIVRPTKTPTIYPTRTLTPTVAQNTPTETPFINPTITPTEGPVFTATPSATVICPPCPTVPCPDPPGNNGCVTMPDFMGLMLFGCIGLVVNSIIKKKRR